MRGKLDRDKLGTALTGESFLTVLVKPVHFVPGTRDNRGGIIATQPLFASVGGKGYLPTLRLKVETAFLAVQLGAVGNRLVKSSGTGF